MGVISTTGTYKDWSYNVGRMQPVRWKDERYSDNRAHSFIQILDPRYRWYEFHMGVTHRDIRLEVQMATLAKLSWVRHGTGAAGDAWTDADLASGPVEIFPQGVYQSLDFTLFRHDPDETWRGMLTGQSQDHGATGKLEIAIAGNGATYPSLYLHGWNTSGTALAEAKVVGYR